MWEGCRFAQRFMMDEFHVKLPRDTFRDDRVRTRYLLEEYKRNNRNAYREDEDALKAMKWTYK